VGKTFSIEKETSRNTRTTAEDEINWREKKRLHL